MQSKVFDARVTSKLESVHMDRWGIHGRGMALFSIKENSSVAEVVTSAPSLGSSIRIELDTTSIAEKADQSSWPCVGTDEDGAQSVVRGPHNIIRTCCEFALEEKASCEVYLGSPSDIIATIRARVRPSVDESSLLFIDDPSDLPVIERPLLAGDASELMSISAGLGLEMSERTAHRILSGQIKPSRSVLARLTHRSDAKDDAEVDLTRDRRGLRVSEADSEEFSRLMERDFSFLGDRYYLSLVDEPRVHVSGDRVNVSFHIEKRD
jgi:hypothetical protein